MPLAINLASEECCEKGSVPMAQERDMIVFSSRAIMISLAFVVSTLGFFQVTGTCQILMPI